MTHLRANTHDLCAVEDSDVRRLLAEPGQIQAELPQTRPHIGAVHAATHAGNCGPVAVFAGVIGEPEVTASAWS